MADGLAFGEYKIGGISAALGKESVTENEKEPSINLDALFSGRRESSLAGFSEKNGDEGKGQGEKRVGAEKDGKEPSRKRQRENRKEKKLKKRKRESEGSGGKEKTTPDEEDTDEETEGKLQDKDDPERLARTVFVGNVHVKTTRKELKELFKEYGMIETTRLRSVPVASMKLPKKVSIIKKEFHPDRATMNAYIVFKNKDDAQGALKKNGQEYKGFHLRVSPAEKQESDNKLSVFVGNLPFSIQEEEIWKHFSTCGEIDGVRVIRDQATGLGKGFAYVAFKKRETVTFALKMRNSELLGRRIRVFPAVDKDSVKKPFNKKKDRNYRMKDITSKTGSKNKVLANKKSGFKGSPSGSRNKTGRPKTGLKNQTKNKNFNKKGNISREIGKKGHFKKN